MNDVQLLDSADEGTTGFQNITICHPVMQHNTSEGTKHHHLSPCNAA
jgi:hypothetical protein